MKSKADAFALGVFVVLSVVLHIAAGVALYFLTPEPMVSKEGPYVVRIVPLEPPPAPGAGEEKAPPPARPQAPVKKKAPPEPAPPPKELSARPSAPAVPERPLSEGKEEKPPVEEGAAATDKKEPISEGPGFSPRSPEPAPAGPGAGNKLFDPEVLAEAVEKGRKPKPPESSVTFDTKEIRHWGYMQRLKERIEYVWEYPQEAASRGIYGDLVLKFVIKEDGSLGAVELVRTSGWQDLDRAAIQALRDGAPYWPLPEDWDTGSLTVTGHFIYTIHGSYYVR